MVEIFSDIPEAVKINTELTFRTALAQNSVAAAAKILSEYVDSCSNDEEKEYANFYFQMKFEELRNGSIID